MRRLIPLLVLLVLPLNAQWPQFRGPNGSGVAEATKLPVDFGPDENVAWRTELPAGHSSPVISGDRIFLTGAKPGERVDAGNGKIVDEGGQLYTICLDRAGGKILWMREAPRPRLEPYQPTNSPASPSPVTDGRSVYVFFGDFGLLAYDFDGNEKWRLPLGPFNNPNGHGSSPILAGDLLIMLCDQDTGSYLLAVEKTTGRVKWKTERPEVTRSYSTPAIFRPATGPAEIIVPGSHYLTSYHAKTGEKLWWISGLSWQPKSAPVVDGEMIYAHWWEAGGESLEATQTPSFDEIRATFDADSDGKITEEEFAAEPRMQRGFLNNDLGHDGFVDEHDWEVYRARRSSRNALLAVRPDGRRGDLTASSSILWNMQKFLPNSPSPLLYDGAIYLIKDGGILTTVQAGTGEILKQGRLRDALDTYYASPVGGAGLVYTLSQGGKMTVLKAGGEWDILNVIDFGEECFATPAIADNALYVRTHGALYCFRGEEE